MDGEVWDRYRERVRADSPMGRSVRQGRLIEDLLAQAAELDARVTRVARGLGPEDMRAFLDVLTMMRARQFAAVSGRADGDGDGDGGTDDGDNDGGTDYQEWFAGVATDMAAGKIPLAQQPGIDRMASLLGLSIKCVAARQLDPVCPPAAESVRTGPDAAVLAAAGPLFRRYSAAQPRVTAGSADAALDAELGELRDRYLELRDQHPAGDENWRFLQWWCAAVTGSLARSAAIQRRTAVAVREFGQAAAGWARLGESGQVADCLTRAAQAALADGADVDEALAPLLRALGPAETAAPATIGRAQLLVRLAQIYLDVGDHFDAGARASEAAAALTGLGFTDPAGPGLDAAFAAWVELSPETSPETSPQSSPEEDLGVLAANRTQARLSAVAEVWAGITRVRTALAPGGDDGATALLHRLLELTGRLGEEAHRVAGEISQEAAALGLAPATPASDRQAVDQARQEAAGRLAGLTALDRELSRLYDEFNQAEGTAQLESLLAQAEALENRVLTGHPTGSGGTAATASVLRSDLLVRLGRLDEAAALLAAARDRLRQDGGLAEAERRSLLVTVISRAAMAEGRRGDFSRMSELCEEGIGEAEHDRGKVNGPYLQDGYLRFRGPLYDWGVFAAHRTGDYERMLARSELAKARGVLGWAVSSGIPAASTADEERFQALTDRASTTGASTPGASTPGASTTGEAAAERRALWDRLMTMRSRSARRAATPAFSLAAVQNRLAADEAVITYHWLSAGTLLMATIDAGSVVAEKVNLTGAQRADLAGLVADVGGITGEAPWLDREARRLGRRLLPRQGRELLAGKERLIISPHRLLHQLPFHAFGFDGAPLIERFAVSYVPNLTSLLLPPRDADPRDADREPVFALGVSRFADPRLVPLPSAGPEARDVADCYQRTGTPVTLLTDGEVTRGRIDELRTGGELGGFGVLHLVTHGDDIPVAAPFDAGLYLPAGRIDGLEISQWRLRADLVVLSACYSARRAISGRGSAGAGAGDEELFGDEVLGLQAAFFAAGARQLLGALWPVADGPARTLMAAFHQHLSAGQPAEVALRRAMLAARDAGLPVYYWAPYKIVRLAGPPGARTAERSVHG